MPAPRTRIPAPLRFATSWIALLLAGAITFAPGKAEAVPPTPVIFGGIEVDGDLVSTLGKVDWFGPVGSGLLNSASCFQPVGSFPSVLSVTQINALRDGCNGQGLKDSTVFGSSDDKNNSCLLPAPAGAPWSCKIGDVPQKDDLSEVYAMSFVDNDPVSPTLGQTFLFVAVGVRETNGDKHLDFEFNQRGVVKSTDSQGNCIMIGGPGTDATCGRSLHDFIVSVDFSGGGSVGTVTLREWEGTQFGAPIVGVGTIGHARINFDDSNVDYNVAAPCGATQPQPQCLPLGSEYQENQYVEAVINLDAAQIPHSVFCSSTSTLMIKSRSSTSFTSELKDFVEIPFRILNPPTVTVNSPAMCAGTSAQLCAVVSGGAGPFTYVWSPGGETTECITVSPTSTTVYTVQVTDAETCAGSGSGTVTVNPNPTATPNSPTICAGASAQVCANASGGTAPYTYVWSTGETTDCITVTPGSTTSYTVTVTDANGCTGSGSGTVTVNPNPTATPSNPTICVGASTQVCANASGGTAPYTYVWSTGETTDCITVTPGSTTSYTVTVTDANGCTGSGSGTVTVNPNPTATPDNPSICLGGGTQVCANASGGTAPYTYVWSTGETTDCITVTPGTTTAYSVTVTDANGCTGSGSGTVTVNPNPTATPSNPSICLGASTQVCANASGGTAPYTYVWSTGETTDCITVSPGTTTAYTVTVTDANGCTGSGSGTVTVNPNPTATPDNPSICLGGGTQVCANPAGGTAPYTYVWSTGATTSCITVSPGTTTSYTVTVTDANNCVGTGSGTVTVNPNPTVSVPDGEFCPASGALHLCATAVGGTPPYTYAWAPGGQTSECIDVTAGGTYTVTVTDAMSCTASDPGTATEHCLQGCTPGFWCGGVGADLWDTADDPQWPGPAGACGGQNPFKQSDLFTSFFASHAHVAGKTMSDLVCTGGGRIPAQKAARDVIAACLNACSGLSFTYTCDQIKQKWLDAVNGVIMFGALHEELSALNQGGCPFGNSDATRLGHVVEARGGTGSLNATSGPDPVESGLDRYELYRPFPNPFTNTTQVVYAVPGSSGERVTVGVFDLAGRQIRQLVNDVMGPGRHQTFWDGRNGAGLRVNNGMYFIHVRVGQQLKTVTVVYVR